MSTVGRRRVIVGSAVLVATAWAAGVAGTHFGATQAQAQAQARAGVVATARFPAGTVARLHQRLVRVTISNYTFKPARLVVSPGTKIVWTNLDGDPHTVSSTKGIFASDALDTNSHYAHVFKQTGTFPYICSIHPFMHGTVIVKK